jgi:hypothetical protein
MRFEPTGIARRAAIRPLIRAIDESCSDWIRLDVSAGVQELHLTADSDIAIALLVDVSFAHCSITPMDSPNLRTGQPVHVGGKCATFIGPQYQVDVIRHRAIDEQRHVESSSSVAEQRQKLFVIIGIAKDTFPSISAVDDMLNAAGNNLPADSRHRVCRTLRQEGAQRECHATHRLLGACRRRLFLVWGTVPHLRLVGDSPHDWRQFRVDCGACYDENAGVQPALHPKELT